MSGCKPLINYMKSKLSTSRRTYFQNNRQDMSVSFFDQHTPRSPLPRCDTHFDVLYQHALDRNKRQEDLFRQDRNRLNQQCTFSPHINPSRTDYEVGVVERNELWMQQKTKRLVEVEQEETLRKLKQCTFSPHIRSKANTFYLKQREKR